MLSTGAALHGCCGSRSNRPSQRAAASGRRHDRGGGRGHQRRSEGEHAPRTLPYRSGRVRLTLEDACSGGFVPHHPSVLDSIRWPPRPDPAGVRGAQVIRLPGRGRRTSDGSRGDLYLKVRLAPSSRVPARRTRIPRRPSRGPVGSRARGPRSGRDTCRTAQRPHSCGLYERPTAASSRPRAAQSEGRPGRPRPHGKNQDPGNLSATDRAFFEALAASSNSGTRRSSGIGG
jgi:hypothetical protein